jgi:endo-1,4-beta-xylanase
MWIRRTGAPVALVAGCAWMLVACGGGGNSAPPPPPDGGIIVPQLPDPAAAPALKAVFAANFLVGAAIAPVSTTDGDATLLVKHMSSITADNALKPDTLQPSVPGSPDLPGAMNFAPADTLVAFAKANNIKMRGHTLLWYVTAPDWFFAGCDADPAGCLPNVRQRLHDYIHRVMVHYGADLYAWDVVNEVVNPDPAATTPYRTNGRWYQTYLNAKNAGANVEPWDYIEDAFRYADEARTFLHLDRSNLKLMINEYNTEVPGKRANLVRIVQDLMNKGVPIDGVGHQLHLRLDANANDVTAALVAIEGLGGGLINQITELDVNVYADPVSCMTSGVGCLASYGAQAPQAVLSQQALLYRALYTAFKRPSVQSVTTWGLADNRTWLNDPSFGRFNHPLLFDTNRNPKWAFWAVVDPTIVVP